MEGAEPSLRVFPHTRPARPPGATRGRSPRPRRSYPAEDTPGRGQRDHGDAALRAARGCAGAEAEGGEAVPGAAPSGRSHRRSRPDRIPSPAAARGGRRSPSARRHEGAGAARHLAAAGLPPPRRFLRAAPLGHAALLPGGQLPDAAAQPRASAAPPASRQPLAAALPPAAAARRPAPTRTGLGTAPQPPGLGAVGAVPGPVPAAR